MCSFRRIFFVILSICITYDILSTVQAASVNVRKREDLMRGVSTPKTITSTMLPTSSIDEPMDVDDEHQHSPAKTNMLVSCDPCPTGILCVPQIQCPAHVRLKDHEKPQVCDLSGGNFGFCCVTGQNHTGPHKGAKARVPFPAILPPSVLEEGRQKFQHLMQNVAALSVQPGQPDFLHGIVFHSSKHEDLQNFHLSNSAMEQVITSQVFAKKEQVPVDDLATNNIDVPFAHTPLGDHCATPHPCRDPRAKYRAFDGSCNNALPQRSHWGAAGQAMERLLPPAYEDGLWSARLHSVDGQTPLMGAREVSRLLLNDLDRPHAQHNLLMMQFGQMLAHDITQTASVRTEGGELIQCCEHDGSMPASNDHFACMPIRVDPADEFYADFKVRCLNFVRLSLAPNTECKLGYGKQRSKVTHFIDASTVYGSNVEQARELRTFRGGRLRMFNDFGHDLLPMTDEKKVCDSDEPGRSCFKSGDGRTNQIISLITMHVVLAREHNRLAAALGRLNPQWPDDKVFQEARRIVIAELQHIVYNEYIPLVIGPVQMKRFRLVPQHHGYSGDYSADVNPALTNEFSGAAFRFGHSTVAGRFHIHEGGQSPQAGGEVVDIPDVMFNPSRMRKRTFYDDMLRTLLEQPMQAVDASISHGLSRYLFRGHNPFGIDLAAVNIQRGRDQGLRGYNDYLELMGHRRVHSFAQLSPEIADKLARVYRHADDVDLWVGGLLERAVPGGVVGITFAEIIADQLSRLKRGDRYFYEYSEQVNPGAFSMAQLDEIRKVTMARLICDNADHWTLMEVQPAAFVRADWPGNQPVRCDGPQIPALNLEAWRRT